MPNNGKPTDEDIKEVYRSCKAGDFVKSIKGFVIEHAIADAAVSAYRDYLAGQGKLLTPEEMTKTISSADFTGAVSKSKANKVRQLAIAKAQHIRDMAHEQKAVEEARKEIFRVLNANKVLLQPRQGQVVFMLTERQWQSLSENQEEVK